MLGFPKNLFLLLATGAILISSMRLCLGVTIQFHSQAKVSKPFIQLGDIAQITDGAPETISQYQQIRLAPSPPSGAQCIIDVDTVRNCILAAGYSNGELIFTGQSRILVLGPTNDSTEVGSNSNESAIKQANYQTAAENQARTQAERILLNALRNELKATLAASELSLAELEIQLDDQDVPEILGTTYLDWKITGWSESLEEPHELLFSKKQAAIHQKPINVRCLVRMPPMVLMAKHHLALGHVITQSDVIWAYSKESGDPISMEQVVGMEAKHAIRPGTPIELADLRIKPYVRTRDLVTVRAQYGKIIVKRTMRALGTGGLGESVELVTLDGKDRFMARVTGFHETEVLETQPEPAR